MKRNLQCLLLIPLLLAFSFAACQMTPRKAAVVSLTQFGIGVNQSYEGYLVAVLKGQASTNNVPKITADYNQVQAGFRIAAEAAHYATNTAVTPDSLLQLGQNLANDIAAELGGAK